MDLIAVAFCFPAHAAIIPDWKRGRELTLRFVGRRSIFRQSATVRRRGLEQRELLCCSWQGREVEHFCNGPRPAPLVELRIKADLHLVVVPQDRLAILT